MPRLQNEIKHILCVFQFLQKGVLQLLLYGTNSHVDASLDVSKLTLFLLNNVSFISNQLNFSMYNDLLSRAEM